METTPSCPCCGEPLNKINHANLGWLNFAGALVSVLFAYWANPAYVILAVGEFGVSLFYFLRRDTQYVCRQCMRRFGSKEVERMNSNNKL